MKALEHWNVIEKKNNLNLVKVIQNFDFVSVCLFFCSKGFLSEEKKGNSIRCLCCSLSCCCLQTSEWDFVEGGGPGQEAEGSSILRRNWELFKYEDTLWELGDWGQYHWWDKSSRINCKVPMWLSKMWVNIWWKSRPQSHLGIPTH